MDSVNLTELEKNVPFDQFSRQYQVAAILDELRGRTGSLRLLDVGGYKGRTADFQPADTVTVMDLFEVQAKNYVRGSALDMPFAEDSFDYIVSFDVLEHIPPDQRQRFFDECQRVAKHGFIICAPQKNAVNEAAETSLNELYQALHGEPHEWLKEHIEYGIPDFAHFERYVQSRGLFTSSFHSNQTQLWMAMQSAIFINSKYSFAAESIIDINHFYNKHFKYDGGGRQTAAYRIILCCLANEESAKRLTARLGSLNEPIDPELEIQLQAKLNQFYLTLGQKQAALADNYQQLHEHELQRATTLQSNGEALLQRIDDLRHELYDQPAERLKRKLSVKKRKR